MINNNYKRNFFFVIAIFLFTLISAAAFAAAGGGGGGSYGGGGGGGGGDGGGELIFFLIVFLIRSGPPGWIVLAVITVAIIYFMKKSKGNGSVYNSFKATESMKPINQVPGYQSFMAANPDYNHEAFIESIKKCYIKIQESWSKSDLKPVRRYLSDGVYQRFSTQLNMMALLKQKNPVSNINIKQCFVTNIERDGGFDIIHLCITAMMNDQFVCETMPHLNSPGGYIQLTEYWSFIRRRGVKSIDSHSNNNCPNCSAPLPEDIGEAGQCSYCKSFVNSGEYDWVLSEITQKDDYVINGFNNRKVKNLSEKVVDLVQQNDDFAVQLIEDKASNGYLQILTSIVKKDPTIMRRFLSDQLFEKIMSRSGDSTHIYNRLYLNNVTLISIREVDNKYIIGVAVKATVQRVNKTGENRATLIDAVPYSYNEVILMERSCDYKASKGSLYAHICPACGAPVKDSLDVSCQYCGAKFNSGANDWVISDLMSPAEYAQYEEVHKKEFEFMVNPALLTETATVKDFALNNIMVIIGADGIFDEEEKRLAKYLSRRWGYNYNRVEPLFAMAAQKQLVIRMPEDQAKRKRIYDLMLKAAEIDGNVSKEEQEILNSVNDKYIA